MNALSNKKLYPVIHCINPWKEVGIEHALRNTRIAMENGADGIFLIGHRMSFGDLHAIYEIVRKQFPNIWIGINFLDVSSYNNHEWLPGILERCIGVNAVWIDELPVAKLNIPPEIQVFGGVAFKYINPQQKGKALMGACIQATETVDVATTSGNATGHAPDVGKLKAIKKYLGGKIPLALASGVDLNNVSLFSPVVDIFIAATSLIEIYPEFNNQERFVPERVREMVTLVHKEDS